MGILVPEANLPMGITVSNVYMSFSGEVIYTIPNQTCNNYIINTSYKVYKDDTKQPDTNIRIPLAIQVSNVSVGVYTSLYENLKQIYPDSVDC
jgi:predicted membrane protein